MYEITIPKMIDLTIRFVVLVLSLTLGMVFLFAGARTALAANLRSVTTISGSVLTVGDLFNGLDAGKASYVLGPAPRPGQDMVLDARTLMRVASALDLPWQPQSSADQVIIRRAATLISTAMITDELKKAAQEKGVSGAFTLSFNGNPAPEMILPGETTPQFEIANLNIDHSSGRFTASLAAPSQENPVDETTVYGQIQKVVRVPVLRAPLKNGDIIGNTDINWIEMGENTIQHDIILSKDELIGMTPRRMAKSGKPLRSNELAPPELVGRGDMITILYEDGPLALSAKGKALQPGGKGDLIRIVNIASNRSIQGIISGDHEVVVTP